MIQGEKYAITLTVVASALGVPKVQHLVYSYDESPPLDDIMSYLTVESSLGVALPPPPSSGDSAADAFVDLIATAAPPPSTSDDSSIRCMLDTIMTVQTAHGQLLVDVLMELQALRAKLASFKRSPLPLPFNDKS
nr:hypothetical protein CFP56_18677 [Quercus suber]